MSNSIITKPVGGWIHPDKLISNGGASYAIRYIGCLQVNVSMKKLDFKTRSAVAKESITRVCEAAGLKTPDKKRRIDKKVLKAIEEEPNLKNAGTNVNLNVSSMRLTLTSLDTGDSIACYDMPRISFASGGDSETLDFVAFIAKDAMDWRACYVLECGGGLAKDVISTIGQAFELRYQQFSKKPSIHINFREQAHNISAHATTSVPIMDIDYYNDLPGKVPPDVNTLPLPPPPPQQSALSQHPPPVPPLPTVVPHPINTLPPVRTPNLIDLNSTPEISPLPHHEYVNDLYAKERDDFGMSPFTGSSLNGSMSSILHQHHRNVSCSSSVSSVLDQRQELQLELWYHGPINRSDAERLLIRDGDFLVRESPATVAGTTTGNQYVLSGMQDATKKHLLLIDPEGVVRTKDRMFNSVSHLINYYFERTLPIISAESALVLRTPVKRTSGTTTQHH